MLASLNRTLKDTQHGNIQSNQSKQALSLVPSVLTYRAGVADESGRLADKGQEHHQGGWRHHAPQVCK